MPESAEDVLSFLVAKYQTITGNSVSQKQDARFYAESICEYFQNLIYCMPGNVYWLDSECRIRGCNKNVVDMFGVDSIDELIGLNFEEMSVVGRWTTGQGEKFKQDTLEVINTGKPVLNRPEPPIPHADGSFLYFLSSRMPLFDKNNKVVGIVGISIDVTEQHYLKIALQEAEQTAKAKMAFIANVSHDIRSPLTGIVGMTRILAERTQNEQDKSDLNLLVEATQHLNEITHQVLELVQLDTKAYSQRNTSFNVADLCNDVIKLMLPNAIAKQLELTYYINDQVPRFVVSDRLVLFRILLNLVSNAIKYTDDGSIALSVNVAQSQTDSFILRIVVQDTGTGIHADKLGTIFDKFVHFNPNYTSGAEGIGLGLYLVKQYIETLRGEIFVESQIGKGSKFICLVPVGQSLLTQVADEHLASQLATP